MGSIAGGDHHDRPDRDDCGDDCGDDSGEEVVEEEGEGVEEEEEQRLLLRKRSCFTLDVVRLGTLGPWDHRLSRQGAVDFEANAPMKGFMLLCYCLIRHACIMLARKALLTRVKGAVL